MTFALVFPGQGSQSVGMGRDLYDNFPTARAVFKAVDEALHEHLSRTIFDGTPEQLTQTQVAQPALMAVSMAALSVLKENIDLPKHFDYVAGHSLGEYSALCAAGVLSLKDTAQLLKKRGEAMAKAAQTHAGKMAAILGLDIKDVRAIAQESGCTIANDNAVGQIVISGSTETVEKARTIATARGAKKAIILNVAGAFHCPLMNDAAEEMKDILRHTTFADPSIPVISNVTALPETQGAVFKELLFEQITCPVQWTRTMDYMKTHGVDTVVEVGAGKVLTGLAKRTPPLQGININDSISLEHFINEIKKGK